ncbi:MAG: OB-fold nucleic acid binding domain-containing protein, partial [Actinomycetota bacterium]|nr:OB-fold nucleic acid binding domain-containing protein [Actinomycetota bacterium]
SGLRHDLPVPVLPDGRQDLNVWERETLGLFLSSHPLKEVRAALQTRVDCGLAELAERRDGDWVTVGGMIAEGKRIRTRKGEPMMFATLDDLEGQVEILVFNSAYTENADKLDVDSVVLVRGRVDHKEQGETKLVVQEVEPFEPSLEEVERASAEEAETAAVPPPRLCLQLEASVPAGFVDDLKEVVSHFPGRHELVLCVGDRTLVLGPSFCVADSSAFRADVASLAGGGVSVA